MTICGSAGCWCSVDEKVSGEGESVQVAERDDKVRVEFEGTFAGPTLNGNINVHTGADGCPKQWTVPADAKMTVLEKAPKPLPTEPAPGSVVRAGGRNFMRIKGGVNGKEWMTDRGVLWPWAEVVAEARGRGFGDLEAIPEVLTQPLPLRGNVPGSVSYPVCCSSKPALRLAFDGWNGARVYVPRAGAESSPCYLSTADARDLALNILATVGVS